jgi:uncharacterized membrane protein YbaN (DUF454 family)
MPASTPSDRPPHDRRPPAGHPAEHETTRLHPSRTVRAVFLIAGFVSLGLGALGVFLPLLPTTVFVLVAAYCFARSSERFHTALLRHKHFGPAIQNWQTHRCISRQSKGYAIGLIALSFGVTTALVLESSLFRVLLVALGAALVLYLYRLPTCGGEP